MWTPSLWCCLVARLDRNCTHALRVWLIAFWCYQTRNPTWCDACAAREAVMCKSYDLVRISVTCCAELDKNQNKRAGTVISVPTWPYLQHPSPQLDIKPANIPQTWHLHSPPHRQTLPWTEGRCQRGLCRANDLFVFLFVSLSYLLMVRLARTPAPMRFVISYDRAQGGGQAP